MEKFYFYVEFFDASGRILTVRTDKLFRDLERCVIWAVRIKELFGARFKSAVIYKEIPASEHVEVMAVLTIS